VPLAVALHNHDPALEQTDDPDLADFFLFPEYLDGLLDNTGVTGTVKFLASLPFFTRRPERHIFYSNHDNCIPLDTPSLFFQVSINRFHHDPNACAIPYPAQWMQDIIPDFDFSRLRYLTSFSGNIASAPIRGELVLSAQREQRLSVYTDPVATFHCHTKSPEEQAQRRKRYLQSLSDSLTVLCPRGEGTNSIRFYETLAAGRIPILASDCCLLPYEEQIDYSSCCLQIAEQDISQAGRILADWIIATGRERLFEICRRGRDVWERYFTEKATIQQAIATLRKILEQDNPASCRAAFSTTGSTRFQAELDHAITLHEQGDYAGAAAQYELLLQRHPGDPQLCYLRGTAALQRGQYPEAITWLERAVNSAPDKAEYATHLAIAHQKNGENLHAEHLLRQVLQSDPTNSIAWLNLGITLHARHRLEEALACFRRAEALAPADPRPPQNAATVCQALGRLDEAERLFTRALILKADYGTARWNLALLRLLRGDYQRGFADFDARFYKTDPIPRRHTNLPAWNGVTDNCRLLIWAEQGLGDTLQFVRYIPLLAARGISVILEVQDHTLLELCRTLSGVRQVIVRGTQPPAADFQAALLDLPRLFGTTLQTIPDHIPYLLTSNEKYRTWRERLPSDKPLVGLVWRGNPGHINDANRSCSLELLLQLTTKLPNIRFLNLQWQPTQAETSLLQQHGIFDPTADLQQLDDTAALLAHLDLLITVDTAVAHLAGALGRPVWMLLPFAPDWRWGVKESSSPWYPSIRLFRQEAPRDWQSIIKQVSAKLADITAESTSAQDVSLLLHKADTARNNEQWDMALIYYYEILTFEPTNITALLGTGGALYFSNRHQEAAAYYRQVIQLQPDNIDAHVNLGMSLLALAAYEEGWRELEWRVQRIRHLLPPIPLLSPEDVRQGHLKGKTVLLHTEQGYGDTLQFVRYTALLAREGASCILTAQPEICELLASCPGIQVVIPHGERLPKADVQTLLQSLPYAFSTNADTIPAEVPYLFPDEARAAIYRNAFQHRPGLKIGLCWQGRQLGKSGYHRSVRLEELAPLFTVPGATFYSLQVEHPSELPDSIGTPSPALQTFSDTAALIRSLDLIITIDTSVAHLAGALGTPTWVLLLWSADWRWLTNREDTPWYPSMRLFRQQIQGDWRLVVNQLAHELKTLTTGV